MCSEVPRGCQVLFGNVSLGHAAFVSRLMRGLMRRPGSSRMPLECRSTRCMDITTVSFGTCVALELGCLRVSAAERKHVGTLTRALRALGADAAVCACRFAPTPPRPRTCRLHASTDCPRRRLSWRIRSVVPASICSVAGGWATSGCSALPAASPSNQLRSGGGG